MNRQEADSHGNSARESSPRARWAKALAGLFLFSVLMGPGPGLYLINPGRGASTTFLGVPIVYLWTVGWFFVMAGVILTAYHVLWKQEGH